MITEYVFYFEAGSPALKRGGDNKKLTLGVKIFFWGVFVCFGKTNHPPNPPNPKGFEFKKNDFLLRIDSLLESQNNLERA